MIRPLWSSTGRMAKPGFLWQIRYCSTLTATLRRPFDACSCLAARMCLPILRRSMKTSQQSEILQRLRSASGHLNAVIKMAEAGQTCEQVLHQLGAVEAALRAAGIKLIICQAQSSQTIILDSPSPKQRISELKRLQSLYTIFIKHSNHNSEVNH